MSPLIALQKRFATWNWRDFMVWLLGTDLQVEVDGYIFDLRKQLSTYQDKVLKMMKTENWITVQMYILDLFLYVRDFIMNLTDDEIYSNRGIFFVKGAVSYEE